MVWDEEGVATLVRGTARVSAVVFSFYLLARARAFVGRRRGARIALAAFVTAHTIHFGTVLLLAHVTSGRNIAIRGGWAVASAGAVLFYAGVFLIARGDRVSERTTRAAVLAAFLIWAAFLQSYLIRLTTSLQFALPVLLLVLAMGRYAVTWWGIRDRAEP